ncbi:MAG TPA: hypothetical protein PKL84_16655, partial [Candidatus Hydrogenedentes bacterium]|nr:hypothetical protein [Candidatus Hydrogenedentota bacterium]
SLPARMARMAKSILYYRRILPVDEIITEIDAVTPADVQALAARIFTPENCALLVLGPGDARPGDAVPL